MSKNSVLRLLGALVAAIALLSIVDGLVSGSWWRVIGGALLLPAAVVICRSTVATPHRRTNAS